MDQSHLERSEKQNNNYKMPHCSKVYKNVHGVLLGFPSYVTNVFFEGVKEIPVYDCDVISAMKFY